MSPVAITLAPASAALLRGNGLIDHHLALPRAALESALLWVMSCADGAHTLLDVAEQSQLPFEVVDDAARALEAHGLVRRGEMARPDEKAKTGGGR